MVENLFKHRQCLWIAAVLRCEFPSPRWQGLFPVGPQILDQCSFHLGHFACTEHAGDRQRHLAQGGKLGDQPAYSLGSPLVRRGAHGANERLEYRQRFQKPFRAASFVGKLVGSLAVGPVEFPDQVGLRDVNIVEGHLVKVVSPGQITDGSYRDPGGFHVNQKLAQAESPVLIRGR